MTVFLSAGGDSHIMSPLLVCGAAALYLVSRDAYCIVAAEEMFVFRGSCLLHFPKLLLSFLCGIRCFQCKFLKKIEMSHDVCPLCHSTLVCLEIM